MSLSWIYVVAGVVFAASAATVRQNTKQHHSQHAPTHHKLSLNASQHPQVEAVLQDFKGGTLKTLATYNGSYVILPHLDVEDFIWEGYSIQLKCSYNEPVQWVYHGEGAPLVKTTTHRLAPILDNKSSFHFGATVIFSHTSYKQTGLYVCESIAQRKHRTDLYVFVPGKKTFILSKDADDRIQSQELLHLTLYANPGDGNGNQWIKIPCAVSNPNASVQLFKDGRRIQELTKNVLFDPKHGFQVDGDDLRNIWGRYKCLDVSTAQNITFEAEPSKYVLAEQSSNSQQDSNKISAYNESPFEISHYAHIKFHYDEKKHLLTCCAFDFRGDRLNQHPTLKYASCESMSECRIARKRLSMTSCVSSPHAVCDGKAMKHHCRGYSLPEEDDAGIVECSLGDHLQEYLQYAKVGSNFITHFDTIPDGFQALEIVEESSRTPGMKTYTCLANSFFFSEGIKWAIQNRTSQLTLLEDDFPSKTSIEINPSDASKLYCFAPVWNSFAWKNVSVLV